MTDREPFRQLFITPVLPFQRDGEIDEPGYRTLLRRFLTPENIEAGVAVIANPEAGEIYTLSREERKRVLAITMDEVAGRTPVLGGVVDVTTAAMVTGAKDAAEAGVDGLFIFPPIGSADITLAWNADLYPEVFLDVLTAIADEVDLPQVIHPVGQFSARYGPGLSADVTRQIVEAVPQVVGWKMTYTYDGYREIAKVLRSVGRPVGIYGAVAKYFHENLANNTFDGSSSGGFNYALERMIEHIAAWRSGDVVRATEIWTGGLASLHDFVFSDFGRLHIRYKTATWLRGFIDNPLMRAPVPAPRRFEVETLTRLLRGAGLPTRPDDEIAHLVAEFEFK